MNAPEKIPSLRSEIAKHLADVGEATAKQLTEALIQDRLAVTHALHDMVKDAEVEREKKRGNEYVYWLSAVGSAPKKPAGTNAEAKPAADFATSPELQYLAPEDYEMPPADPVLLAMANRELADRLEEKDRTPLSQARVVIDLRAQVTDQGQSIDSLTKDVINTRTALNKAINEADRLRGELAAERQAREALQEQADAVDVTEAAVGYLVRAPKRKPRMVTKPERAREAALAAVRAGAGRAEVLAVVPVGVARRGAEWRENNHRPNGD